jgi:hypothetical protein
MAQSLLLLNTHKRLYAAGRKRGRPAKSQPCRTSFRSR